MRYFSMVGATLLAVASPSWAEGEETCVKDLVAKNYQQNASTGELAKLISDDCLQRTHPDQFRQVAIGTARQSDERFISQMSDVLYQLAVQYLKELRGEAIHLNH